MLRLLFVSHSEHLGFILIWLAAYLLLLLMAIFSFSLFYLDIHHFWNLSLFIFFLLPLSFLNQAKGKTCWSITHTNLFHFQNPPEFLMTHLTPITPQFIFSLKIVKTDLIYFLYSLNNHNALLTAVKTENTNKWKFAQCCCSVVPSVANYQVLVVVVVVVLLVMVMHSVPHWKMAINNQHEHQTTDTFWMP